jgi:hypothetical protein
MDMKGEENAQIASWTELLQPNGLIGRRQCDNATLLVNRQCDLISCSNKFFQRCLLIVWFLTVAYHAISKVALKLYGECLRDDNLRAEEFIRRVVLYEKMVM